MGAGYGIHLGRGIDRRGGPCAAGRLILPAAPGEWRRGIPAAWRRRHAARRYGPSRALIESRLRGPGAGFTGHGASGGETVTYGILEAEDIARWAAWLSRQPGVMRVYGLGESMGAANLIESLPRRPGFRAIVAECPVRNVRRNRRGPLRAAFRRKGRSLAADGVDGVLLRADAIWDRTVEGIAGSSATRDEDSRAAHSRHGRSECSDSPFARTARYEPGEYGIVGSPARIT